MTLTVPVPESRPRLSPSFPFTPAQLLPGRAATSRLPYGNPLFGRSDLETDVGLGGTNGLFGGLELAAHPAAWTPQVAALLARAGFELPRVTPYTSRGEYRAVLADLARRCGQLVTMFPQHPDDLPAEGAALDPTLLTRLADKGQLDALTGRLAPRRTLRNEPSALRAATHALRNAPHGWVLKASHAPTGGGADVHFCPDRAALADAAARYPAGTPLLLEPRLSVDLSPSAQLAVLPSGEVRLLGLTTQRLAGPRFAGVDLRPLPRAERYAPVALEVAQACAARGYRGVLGVDLMDTGVEVLVAEVNPRLTGGSLAGLLAPQLGLLGLQARLVLHPSARTLDDLCARVGEGWEEGRLLPVMVWDGARWGGANRVAALLLGRTDTELDGQDAWLRARLAEVGVAARAGSTR